MTKCDFFDCDKEATRYHSNRFHTYYYCEEHAVMGDKPIKNLDSTTTERIGILRRVLGGSDKGKE